MIERLDVLVTEGGFAPSREKAKALIMSGNVFVNGQLTIDHSAGCAFLGSEPASM